jgi:PAS domain S-box-containing protein
MDDRARTKSQLIEELQELRQRVAAWHGSDDLPRVATHRRAEDEADASSATVRLNRELTALNEIGQALISTLDLQETLTIVTDHVTRLMGAAAASVVLHDKEKDDLWFAAASGKGTDSVRNSRLAMGQGIVGWVIQHGEAAIVPDASQDHRWLNEFDKKSGLTTRSILSVPLQTRGQTIGAIEVINKEGGPFDREDLRLLTSLAAPAATAIETAQLYARAQIEIAERARTEKVRAQAEAALRESESRLSTLLNLMPNGIVVIDAETHQIVDANPAALKMMGRFSEQVLGSVCHDFICPAHEGRCPITDLGQAVDHSERVLLNADGQRVPILKTATCVTLDGREHLLESFIDITDLKEAREALQASEERYRAILGNIKEGYYEVDLAGTLTFFNDALCDIVGESADKLMGMNNREYMDAETAKMVYQTFNTVYHTGELIHALDWKLVTKDGEERFVEISISLMHDAAGDPIGFHGILRDVTGRKQAEAEHKRLLATLEYRSTQLQTAAEVSRAVGSILDPEALAPQVVDLVRERFNLYYAGLFLVDQTGEWTHDLIGRAEPHKWAVLRAGTGEAGRQMLQEGYKLEIGGSSMIGWCIANKQARITLDVGEDAVRFSNPYLPKTRSELALPLISRGRPIGALTIQSDQEAAFSEEDIVALQTMADQMANAISNARLYNQAHREINERKRAEEETQRRATQAALIYEVGRRVSGELELEKLLAEVVVAVRDVFDCYGVTLLLLDEKTGRLTLRAVAGVSSQDFSLAIGEGIAGQVAATGKPQISGDVRRESHSVRMADEKTKSELSAPIKIGPKVIGVLDLQGDKFNAFDEADMMVVETMADQIAVAIRNAQLYQAAQQELAERQRAEEALRTSEERNRMVVENASEAIFVVQDGMLKFVNPQAVTLTGYSREEITSRPFIEFIHPDDREMVIERHMKQLGGEDIPPSYPFKIIGKDGNIKWVELNAVMIQWEGKPATLNFMADITGRRQATAALQQAHQELARYTENLERRTAQLQVGAEVAREAAAILDVQRLLDRAVHLVSERFGFYHAGAFLIDEAGKYAILRAASSEGGHRMLERGHKLPIGKLGIVGYVAATGEPRIALDVGEDAVYFDNPDMPYTRSEMGLPLKIRGQTIGVLDVQDTQEAAFSEDDVAVLQTLADQLAVAIDNARLVERAETQLRELNLLYGKYSTSAWADLMTPDRPLSYVYDRIDVMPVDKLSVPALDIALARGETVAHVEPETQERVLATPLRLHDQIIGSLGIQEANGGRGWSPQEIALIEAVSEQVALALENAQHFAETQKAAQQRQVLNELARALATHLDIESVLKETYWGASRLLDTTNFYIALYDEERHEISLPLNVTESQTDQSITGFSADQGLTGYVIRTRESTLIKENLREWQAERNIPLVGELARSWVGVPMLIGDRVLGVIAAQSYTTPNTYDESDRDILVGIAGQTAIALQNAHLFGEARIRTEELAVLNELAQSLTTRLNVPEIVEETYRGTSRLLDTTNFYIALYDAQSNTISFPLALEGGQRREYRSRQLGAGLSEHIIRSRQPLLIEENVSEWMSEAGIETIGRPALSWLGVPLIIGNQVQGAIAIQSDTAPRAFDEHDRDLLTAIASQTAIALQNAYLFGETEAALSETEALYLVGEIISRLGEEEETFQNLANVLVNQLGYDSSWIALVDERTQMLKGVAGAGVSTDIILSQVPLNSYAHDPAVQAVLKQTSIVINDVSTDERADDLSDHARAAFGRLIETPILVGNKAVGAIAVSRPVSGPEISPRDVEVLRAVADQAAVALQNIRLLEETQRRAEQERQIYEITSKIRRSPDIRAILQTAVNELGQVLQVDRALVRLTIKPRAERALRPAQVESPSQPAIADSHGAEIDPSTPE